jgi:protein TonB
MSSLSFAAVGPPGAVKRVVWPLACSLAIHLGLGTLAVLAGSVALPWQQPPRAVWLDLEPMVIPAPPIPAPPPPVTPPRPARPPVVEPRKTPVLPPPVSEQPVAPPAPSPPPPREVTTPELPVQSPPSPPQTAVAVEPVRASDSDRSGAPPIATAGERVPQERSAEGAGQAAVASRTPDSGPSSPIVRAARPRGGYQVRPIYPESARRAGIQGTTLLRIHIEADGHVSDVSVQRSAGHQSLDEAAADAVRRWRFEPALNSAGPVSMWAVVPVQFRISDRD